MVDKKVCMLYPFIFFLKKKNKENEEKDTNFNGSNSKSTSFEKQTNTTRSNTFAKATNNSTSHQHVLHFFFFSMPSFFLHSLQWQTEKNNLFTQHWKTVSYVLVLVFWFVFHTLLRESSNNTESVFAPKICRVWRNRRESRRR